MIVGFCQIDIYLPGSKSLKDKRASVKKIIERTKNRFNVSIAEVEDNQLWQRTKIGIATVGNGTDFVRSTIDSVIKFITDLQVGEVIDTDMEITSLKPL